MGFIAPDAGGADAFVHRSDLSDGQMLTVGSTVSFEDGFDSTKGKRTAKNVVGAVYPAGKGGGGPPPPAGSVGTGAMLSGVVRIWKEERGMGFIAPDSGGDDAFVHRSNLLDGQRLQVGSQVTFEDSWDAAKNKRAAVNVTGAVPDGAAGVPAGYGAAPPPPTGPPPLQAAYGQAGSSAPQGGTVKAWIEERGMGFLRPDAGGEDVFVHRSALADSEWLVVGDAVVFSQGWDAGRGKMLATWCSVAAAVPGLAESGPARGAPPPPPGGGRGGVVTGVVKTWIEQRGMGFIKPDSGGDDVFVHRSDILDAQWLVEGTPVQFEEHWDTGRGKRIARRVCGAGGASGGAEGLLDGVMKMWLPERGFGFIVPSGGGDDVMIHINEVSPGAALAQGVRVQYTAVWDPAKGKMKATSCVPAADAQGAQGAYGAAACSGGKGDPPPPPGGDGPWDNLFVAGLPQGIAEDQVREMFGQYGIVANCRVLASNGKPDAAALVQMSDPAAAEWLVENLNGNIPSGMTTPVRVSFASKGGHCKGGGRAPPYGKG
ncbi:unnamed protein product [Prorocentrum cordatum]|uniref:Uncharacterized protein n=1 Tax=Prorocentrum cordatum TaxID=2364126 RepID=A0ABN9W5N6_9DINO|nr:unnamed protein product [Polarella glacialis]